MALSKLGARALYLNTAFAAPQLAEVVAQEQPVALVYDREFAGLLKEAGRRRKRVIAWPEDQRGGDDQTEELIADGATTDRSPSGLHGRAIVLTSGTAGTPCLAAHPDEGATGCD